jgi:hypothetical protein
VTGLVETRRGPQHHAGDELAAAGQEIRLV